MIYSLVSHPATPSRAVEGVSVHVESRRDHLSLLFSVDAAASALVIPPKAKPYRADDLWRSTCFELFVQMPGSGYQEFNFSPSTQWAAYAFDSYRSGRNPLGVGATAGLEQPPVIWTEDESGGVIGFHLGADLGLMPGCPAIALCAVIEEQGGFISYWALAHPPGAPDFHNPACFAATLPPPPRA